VTYELKVLDGEPIKGRFYEPEIQKVLKSDDERFDIDRILKTRKRNGKIQYLVSLKGYSSKFDSSTRGSINSSSNSWKVCGGVDAPKDEIVYCCQVFVAFVVILTGLVNLTFTESDTCLWTGLISGALPALGYLLPNRGFVAMSRFHLTLPSNDAVLPSEHGGNMTRRN